MKSVLISIRDVLVSLKLTVGLLAFGMLLVIVATLDQVNLGIWAVQQKYFQSFVVYTRLGDFIIPAFPGGYTVGGLLLANLIASHIYRFGFKLKKSGIILTHLGLILLLVGELLTGLWQKEHYMRLDEGQTKSYAEAFRANELAIVDVTDPASDLVVAIPEPLLASEKAIQHRDLPFRVVPKAYYPNSEIHQHAGAGGKTLATAGFGTSVAAVPQPVTYAPNTANAPSAFVEFVAPDKSLGTFLVSRLFEAPQEFTHEGRTWRIMLRTERVYYPFSLTLLDFTHDKYPGTEIPKNFASKLRLKTPNGRDDREVRVYMNNPLRYAGLTFYQSSFDNNDTTSILQVVRNPSWVLPYVATVLMSLGLTLQFAIHLVGFVNKRRRAAVPVPATT